MAACGFMLTSFALTHSTRVVAATSSAISSPVLAWGTNFFGEAGNDGAGDQHYCCASDPTLDPYNDYPVQATGVTDAVAVSAGGFSSAAIVRGHAADGTPDATKNTVWTWGDDHFGQLGARAPDTCREPEGGTTIARFPCAGQPVQVRGPGGNGELTGIVAVADGGRHVLALRDDGTVWAWGDDLAGELGVNPPSRPNPACPTVSEGSGSVLTGDQWCVPYPIQVPGLSGVTSIAAGDLYSVATVHQGGLGPDDAVWVWGDNTVGELGRGWDCDAGSPDPAGTCASPSPAEVPGLQGVNSVAAGSGGDIMAIVSGQAANGSDNRLWTWGGVNANGESGIAQRGSDAPPYSPIDSPTPVLDTSGAGFFTGAVAVSTGGDTVAIKYDPALQTTTVWDWGSGSAAASGTPEASGSGWPTPRQVRGPDGDGFLTGGVAVAAADDSSYMLKADGTVWGWGGDGYGQLAVSQPQTPKPFPVQARGIAGATAIAGGLWHVLALANTPPPSPPVAKQTVGNNPPALPFEQLPTTAAPIQPPQPPATVPVVNPGVAPSTVNQPPQPPAPGGSVTTQPVSSPAHAASPAQATAVQMPGLVQGSQLVTGTAPVPGSPGAVAPSVGDRPTPTDQLAMVRHEDAADAVSAVGIGAAAAGALIACLMATARARRPPAARPAPAWAPAGERPRPPAAPLKGDARRDDVTGPSGRSAP